MKVVFVDFDGVLNNDRTPIRTGDELWGASQIEVSLVALLNDLVTRSGARVVVSSSWRMIHKRTELLAEILQARGFVGEVLDMTPVLYRLPDGDVVVRGHEVELWLSQHPEVERYVILDDDATFLDAQGPYLIRTDPAVGLTLDDVARALALLGAR